MMARGEKPSAMALWLLALWALLLALMLAGGCVCSQMRANCFGDLPRSTCRSKKSATASSSKAMDTAVHTCRTSCTSST